MADKRTADDDIKAAAIALVKQEVENYEDAEVFVTERVAFRMRDLIRTLRKNYWGVFDQPTDPITGRKKIWVPLTREIVDACRKNSDLDAKDMNFRSTNGRKGVPITNLVRGAVRKWMRDTFFGETLDQTITPFSIDGTAVWKTWEGIDDKGRVAVKRRDVDVLNCYIDPTADSIQSAPLFTERALLLPHEVEAMDWMDNEEMSGTTGLSKNDPKLDQVVLGEGRKYVEVFEAHGVIPKWLITGKNSDKKKGETVPNGRIVVSGLRRGQNPRLHVLELHNHKDKQGNYVKPYEEAWYMKVPGRWYGVGPAEMVIMLQVWLNIIVNLRINKNYVAQLGLFKVKANAGITPKKMANLASNGIIKVNSMDDIESMVVQEAGQSSYEDEQTAVDWARRVTSAFEVITGKALPSSTPATNAVIQDRNAKSSFVIVKDSLGFFLQRWMDRHVLRIIAKQIRKGDCVVLYDDFENIEELRKRVVAHLAMENLEELYKERRVITEPELIASMQEAEERLSRDGDLFLEVLEGLVVDNVDTHFFVTNEEIDVGVIVSNLISLVPLDPENRIFYVEQAMDLLGLQRPPKSQLPGMMPQQMETPQGMQQLVTQANTLNGAGTFGQGAVAAI